MLISELLDSLKLGKSVATIAKSLEGVGEKRLRKALKDAGYEFNNSGVKGWFYVGEGEQPLSSSIFDFVDKSIINSTGKEVVSEKNIESNNRLINSNIFSSDEIVALKKLANSFITEGNNQVLKDKIREIENADRVRKTFHISVSLINKFDDLAIKNDVSKSDLLELALLDLLERYQ